MSYEDENGEVKPPEVTEYKGNNMLSIHPDSKWPFSFGLKKAQMILDNLPYIQAFVKSGGVNCEIVEE